MQLHPEDTPTMVRTNPNRTTYCYEHERIETIQRVTKVEVYSDQAPLSRQVWATTHTDCEVIFIGSARWKA